MAQVDIVVFDKTGTLTEGGEPAVLDFEVFPVAKWERKIVLGIAAEMESASSHPLGTAIRAFCEAQFEGASLPSGSMFEEVAGRGLKAHFEELQCTAIIGNEAWLEEHGAVADDMIGQQLRTWKSEAKSVVLLAIRDESGDRADSGGFTIAAIFAVADRLRPEARSVVSHLQHQGIGTWMISGDNAVTARAVAEMVGIPTTNVIAGVLPHEKVMIIILMFRIEFTDLLLKAQKIQWLQQVGAKRTQSKWRLVFAKSRLNKRCVVAMVGDGINDAPVRFYLYYVFQILRLPSTIRR
jgi:cation transport ATPase